MTTEDVRNMLETKQYEKIADLLGSDMPDRFKSWLRQWVNRLQLNYDRIDFISRAIVDNRPGTNNRAVIEEYFNEPGNQQYAGLCSGILDHKDISNLIWEMVKQTTISDSFDIDIKCTIQPTSLN